MRMELTYNLFYGLVLLVLAAFIAVPAWSKWTRNLLLVRRGVKTLGHYHGVGVVVFLLADGRQMRFTTWRRAMRVTNAGDALSVLYDPADPSKAEVMKMSALWMVPMRNLASALALVLQAVWLFLGMNLAVSVLLSLAVSCGSFLFASLALVVCYPSSRLHQFAEVEESAEVEIELGQEIRSRPQQHRLQRRLAWKQRIQALPTVAQEIGAQAPEAEDELQVMRQEQPTDTERAVCAEPLPPPVPRRKAARDQLVRDIMGLSAEEDEQ